MGATVLLYAFVNERLIEVNQQQRTVLGLPIGYIRCTCMISIIIIDMDASLNKLINQRWHRTVLPQSAGLVIRQSLSSVHYYVLYNHNASKRQFIWWDSIYWNEVWVRRSCMNLVCIFGILIHIIMGSIVCHGAIRRIYTNTSFTDLIWLIVSFIL